MAEPDSSTSGAESADWSVKRGKSNLESLIAKMRSQQATTEKDEAIISIDKKKANSVKAQSNGCSSTLAKQTIGGCLQCSENFSSQVDILNHIVQRHPGLIFLRQQVQTSQVDSDNCKKSVNKPNFGTEPNLGLDAAELLQESDENLIDPVSLPETQVFESFLSKISPKRSPISSQLNYFMCSECSMTFENAEDYEEHLTVHLQSTKIEASTSVSSFPVLSPSVPVLPRGVSPVSGLSFKCLSCSAVFHDVNMYQEHLRNHHGASVLTCEICKDTFGTSFELNRHMGSHTGAAEECKTCGACFESQKLLSLHVAVAHFRVKSPDFFKSFHQSPSPGTSRLTVKYKCFLCNEVFPRKSALMEHRKTSHDAIPASNSSSASKIPKMDFSKWICPECGEITETTAAMELHKKAHEQEKMLESSTSKISENSNDQESADESPNSEEIVSYPKFKPVKHHLENDYLDGILQGICGTKRPNSTYPKRPRGRPPLGSENPRKKKCLGKIASKSQLDTSDKEGVDSSSNSQDSPPSRENSVSPDRNANSRGVKVEPSETATSSIATAPEIVGPWQNDYFKDLVQSNVKRYNRRKFDGVEIMGSPKMTTNINDSVLNALRQISR